MPRNEREHLDIASLGDVSEIETKIEVSGLAYCKLDKVDSEISFLTHVKHHELKLTILKRLGSKNYPKQVFKIQSGDVIDVHVEQSIEQGTLSNTTEGFPLEEMVNINVLHGGDKNNKVIAPIPNPLEFPTIVKLKHAQFYTSSINEFLYKFVERPGSMAQPPKPLGYKLGGIIKAKPDDVKTKLVITSRGNSLPGRRLEFDGCLGGRNFSYELIFDNHCPDTQACKKELADLGKPDTDFFFYYDLLEDTKVAGRKFDLIYHATEDKKPEPDTMSTGSFRSSRTEPADPEREESSESSRTREGAAAARPITPLGGTDGVAACNPVITEPGGGPY